MIEELVLKNGTNKKRFSSSFMPPIPVDGGAARRVLGFLKYFRDRKDFFSVDAVASNAIGGKSWTGKEKQAVLDYVENFFIYKGEKNFIDFFTLAVKAFTITSF